MKSTDTKNVEAETKETRPSSEHSEENVEKSEADDTSVESSTEEEDTADTMMEQDVDTDLDGSIDDMSTASDESSLLSEIEGDFANNKNKYCFKKKFKPGSDNECRDKADNWCKDQEKDGKCAARGLLKHCKYKNDPENEECCVKYSCSERREVNTALEVDTAEEGDTADMND